MHRLLKESKARDDKKRMDNSSLHGHRHGQAQEVTLSEIAARLRHVHDHMKKQSLPTEKTQAFFSYQDEKRQMTEHLNAISYALIAQYRARKQQQKDFEQRLVKIEDILKQIAKKDVPTHVNIEAQMREVGRNLYEKFSKNLEEHEHKQTLKLQKSNEEVLRQLREVTAVSRYSPQLAALESQIHLIQEKLDDEHVLNNNEDKAARNDAFRMEKLAAQSKKIGQCSQARPSVLKTLLQDNAFPSSKVEPPFGNMSDNVQQADCFKKLDTTFINKFKKDDFSQTLDKSSQELKEAVKRSKPIMAQCFHDNLNFKKNTKDHITQNNASEKTHDQQQEGAVVAKSITRMSAIALIIAVCYGLYIQFH
ncbi:hypothetical protein [Bartonella tamiae]|uniref:Uncharacterized protein n=1 Tax=Bartonella tamiae Th239 TaxID=1094558 RepID=J1JZX6_9HYPH|nr:hypothetical protein [Bartonella tamiae]EJF90310.1 hypothetical protein ME5_00711 [Bartonella tamiae Th239]EJF93749.1 hypothetical protein MEG_01173 [Bartonella tamiae Th307]